MWEKDLLKYPLTVLGQFCYKRVTSLNAVNQSEGLEEQSKMRLSLMCLQDRGDTWFKGSRDERAVRALTLLDTDTENPMPNTMDYRLSAEEMKEIPAGSLNQKSVTISVRDIKPGNGGRLVLVGSLVQPVNGSTLPNGGKANKA